MLAALGVSLDLTPEQVGRCIDEVGIGFLFAPKFHPAMKHAVGPRRELGQRTIFNVLGPLTNPASATHQIIGVYDPDLTQILAEVLGALGSHAALVFHGHGGLDELTTAGPNRISHLCEGSVRTFDFDPADPEPAGGPALPFRRAASADLRGGDPAENARMLRDLLAGRDDSPRRDVVLLNAAAALAVDCCDLADNPHEVLGAALGEAERSLAGGAALAKLDGLIALSQAVRTGTDGGGAIDILRKRRVILSGLAPNFSLQRQTSEESLPPQRDPSLDSCRCASHGADPFRVTTSYLGGIAQSLVETHEQTRRNLRPQARTEIASQKAALPLAEMHCPRRCCSLAAATSSRRCGKRARARR